MPGLTVHFEVLNQLNSPALYADTLANRPAAQLVGRIFFRTDSPFGIYRDTGTSWDLIANPDTTGISGSGLAGQVPYFTGASTIGGTNNLFWDSTNNRLGINTATPGVSLDIHGAGSIVHINGTGTSNAFQAFQNAGTTKWRIGNNYSAATNYFSIYDFANSVESFKLESGATNILTITATTNNQGNVHIQKAGANPRLEIQQDTPSATNKSEAVFLAPVGFGAISKYTASTTANKIILGNDFGIYNYASSGDIAILNDFATGKIKFAAGGSSTAQATLTAAGRFLLGTTTESTYLLDVNGQIRSNAQLVLSNYTSTSSYPGTAAGYLAFDSSGNILTVAAGSSTNIYNTDGTLTGDRTLTNNTYLLKFVGGKEIITNEQTALRLETTTTGKELIFSLNNLSGKNYLLRSLQSGIFDIRNITDSITPLSIASNGDSTFSGNIKNSTNQYTIGTYSLVSGIWFSKASPTSSNYALNSDASETYLNNQSGGGIHFRINNATKAYLTANARFIIGSTTENASAILKLDSTASGFLPPRMTTTQKNAIGTPAQGLMVFDTTLVKLCVYSGTAWETITSV
jgi:hypothetical protein